MIYSIDHTFIFISSFNYIRVLVRNPKLLVAPDVEGPSWDSVQVVQGQAHLLVAHYLLGRGCEYVKVADQYPCCEFEHCRQGLEGTEDSLDDDFVWQLYLDDGLLVDLLLDEVLEFQFPFALEVRVLSVLQDVVLPVAGDRFVVGFRKFSLQVYLGEILQLSVMPLVIKL